MKFCKVCENMLYVSASEMNPTSNDNQNQLQFVCKNCAYKEVIKRNDVTDGSIPIIAKRYDNSSMENDLDTNCIMRTNYFDDIRSFQQYQTKNIKFDPALPRVNNIECPRKCGESRSKGNKVICVRYDLGKMKYLYMCCHCDHFWKNEKI